MVYELICLHLPVPPPPPPPLLLLFPFLRFLSYTPLRCMEKPVIRGGKATCPSGHGGGSGGAAANPVDRLTDSRGDGGDGRGGGEHASSGFGSGATAAEVSSWWWWWCCRRLHHRQYISLVQSQ